MTSTPILLALITSRGEFYGDCYTVAPFFGLAVSEKRFDAIRLMRRCSRQTSSDLKPPFRDELSASLHDFPSLQEPRDKCLNARTEQDRAVASKSLFPNAHACLPLEGLYLICSVLLSTVSFGSWSFPSFIVRLRRCKNMMPPAGCMSYAYSLSPSLTASSA